MQINYALLHSIVRLTAIGLQIAGGRIVMLEIRALAKGVSG